MAAFLTQIVSNAEFFLHYTYTPYQTGTFNCPLAPSLLIFVWSNDLENKALGSRVRGAQFGM